MDFRLKQKKTNKFILKIIILTMTLKKEISLMYNNLEMNTVSKT